MPESQLIDGAGGAAGSPGPAGVRTGLRQLLPLLVSTTAVVSVLGYLQKVPCKRAGFDFIPTVRNACYTDIYPLYFGRGLADGKIPYLDKIPEPVEYPVLTGGLMQAAATPARWFGGADVVSRGMWFFNLTAVLLVLCAAVTVLATALVAGRQSRRAGLMVAASPALLLTAYINWDLLAVALSALALAAWARRRPGLAGGLLGLAVAAKFYPLIFLGPLFLLCLRAGKWREFGRLLAGTVVAWLVVNVPIMLAAWDSWSRFYTFNQKRSVDWGSVFFLAERKGMSSVDNVPTLNLMGEVGFVVLALAVALLVLFAPRRPRLPQVLFLTLAAFLLTNKVWSPQYVLWLVPLVALARPKLPAFLLWQAGEVVYFFGIWWYLLAGAKQHPGVGLSATLSAVFSGHAPAAGIDDNVYYIALLARFLTVLLLVVLVVVDILVPRLDVVRADGVDDPAGGVLDGAEDRVALVRRPAPWPA
ncbi:glycosyltransferase 87 family protein [Actinoallomurus purpureus]|uniref:glycosyltransferase family 87 protein n=1 Tax=Actinoallomurus purpureus TaxID=478114 RepID=UPI00209376C5|nr:glycosyltransferase 87 family protein [Actinoallomurus purpureus]MCO6007273.1 glycosyltransferase 87 family protein [Actinoallomurus purpureus]